MSCVHPSLCCHRKRRHDNCHGADISSAVFHLSKTVNIESICGSASHGTEERFRVISVIACVSAPIHISIVGIKPCGCGLQGKTKQIIVWVARLTVDTSHTLENSAWENRGFMQPSNSLNGNIQQRLCDHPSLRKCTGAIIDGRERELIPGS